MKHPKHLFIIGHPGAGKAVLAKAVAEKLGWQYVDADSGLEFHVGRMLSEIVGSQGAKSFYNCQSEILTTLKSRENIVVTTDGSILNDTINRKLLEAEYVIYLKVSTSVQLERTSRNAAPLLSIKDLPSFFDELHQERDVLYETAANLIINGDDSDLDKHVSLIVENILGSDGEQNLSNQTIMDEKDKVIFHKTTHIAVHLSDQQALCLKLLAQGKSSKEIAQELKISYRTVEGHIAKAMEQLGCSSSKELIALYYDKP